MRRGIRFAFWSGHSQGRYAGSAWYADHAWRELHQRCVVHLNVDSTGARGATGTMASSPFTLPCEKCGHVSRRSLEEIASGPALVARYNARASAGARSGQEVLAAAEAGDADAIDAVRSAGEALGANVGFLVNVLDPESVVVGGGLGLSEGPYWESFLASTRRHLWSAVHRQLPILRAATGPTAGLIGAAAAAWIKLREAPG